MHSDRENNVQMLKSESYTAIGHVKFSSFVYYFLVFSARSFFFFVWRQIKTNKKERIILVHTQTHTHIYACGEW